HHAEPNQDPDGPHPGPATRLGRDLGQLSSYTPSSCVVSTISASRARASGRVSDGGLGNIVGVEQCLGRAAGGAGGAQGAQDGLHDGAVEDDDQLVGKELGICGLATFGLAGEVAAELELVVAGDLPGWVAGVG